MKKLSFLIVLFSIYVTGFSQESAKFLIDTVYFEFDQYLLKDESKAELDSMIKQFGSYPSYYIEIFGHTDSIGSDAYNLKLSELRARAVSLYLVERGINLNRITYEGLGTTKPVTENVTFAGRRQNRRADVAVVFSSEVYEPIVEVDTTPVEMPVVEVDPASITDTIYCDYNPFPFNPLRRNYIVAPEGTIVIIPPNSFQTESSELMGEIDELFYRSDMIKNEMTTIGREGPLEAVGMFNVSVTDRGRAVRMTEGSQLEALLPATRKDKDMTLYAGSGGNRGGTRSRGRGNRPSEEEMAKTPTIGTVRSWSEVSSDPVDYTGFDRQYRLDLPKPGKYAVARPLYYSQNTDRKDNGVDIQVKLKGKRYERNTNVMIVGEVVKTYIPLRKINTRNYEARKVKFVDPKTDMILIAIQYDSKGNPWLIKRNFTVGSIMKKPKKKKRKSVPVVKIKAKFRKVSTERLNELLNELNV